MTCGARRSKGVWGVYPPRRRKPFEAAPVVIVVSRSSVGGKDPPKPPFLKAVIFDVDGVLIRSMEKHFEAYRAAFRPYGVEIEQPEVFTNEGRGSRDVAVAVSTARRMDLSDAELDAIAKAKQRIFESFGPMPKYPGVDELIARLHARGLKLAMVTGTSRVNIQNHFRDWIRHFDVVVTADDVKRTKPDPEPYLRAVEKLGVAKDEAIVVENAPLGIRSAKAAGLRVIAVTSTNPPDVLKDADVIAEKLADVEVLL